MLAFLIMGANAVGASTVPEVPDITDDEFTGVGITPARVDADLDARAAQLDIVVFNDTEASRTITVEVTELGHNLDGRPQFGGLLGDTATVGGAGTFTLESGQSRTIDLVLDFPNDVAEYVAVVATVEPIDENQTVTTRTQVASLLLLRGPRPWDQTLEVAEVGLEYEDGATEAALYADVENVGNAHVRPSGRFIVRQEGEELATVELPGENILPGFARRLRAAWVPDPDASGPIDIELELDDGPSATGQADLGDIPGRLAEERRDQGLPATGATLSVDNDVPALLSIGALILLITALALLLIVWRRRKDEEEEDEEDEPVPAGAGSAAGEDEGS